MNEPSDTLNALIRISIGVLCGGALVLIALILSGTGIDETSGKVIATAVALAFFSLTGALAGSGTTENPVPLRSSPP